MAAGGIGRGRIAGCGTATTAMDGLRCQRPSARGCPERRVSRPRPAPGYYYPGPTYWTGYYPGVGVGVGPYGNVGWAWDGASASTLGPARRRACRPDSRRLVNRTQPATHLNSGRGKIITGVLPSLRWQATPIGSTFAISHQNRSPVKPRDLLSLAPPRTRCFIAEEVPLGSTTATDLCRGWGGRGPG